MLLPNPDGPAGSPRRSRLPRSASPRHRWRPGPEAGASAPNPSRLLQWRAVAVRQNQPAAGSAWRTSFVRHLESDSRPSGNPPASHTLRDLVLIIVNHISQGGRPMEYRDDDKAKAARLQLDLCQCMAQEASDPCNG